MKIWQWTVISVPLVCITAWWIWCPLIQKFPELTGPYRVGYMTEYVSYDIPYDSWIAQNSTFDASQSTLQQRQLTVHLWYPAQVANFCVTPFVSEKMPFLEKAFAAEEPWLAPLVPWLLSGITTHACPHAPLERSGAPYPVILFSHGLLGTSSDVYASMLEELASHGFIVAGIDHTYLNILTLDAQGALHTCMPLTAAFNRMSVSEQMQFQTGAIATYKADMRAVIQALLGWNGDETHALYHALRTTKFGVMGHSAGGTAALECVREEPRIGVCIDLDGWYDHAISWDPMPVPTLLLFGSKSLEVTEPTFEYLKRKGLTREGYYEREKRSAEHTQQICQGNDCVLQIIQGANHDDFGGFFWKWPLRPWRAINAAILEREINGAIVACFKKYLINSD